MVSIPSAASFLGFCTLLQLTDWLREFLSCLFKGCWHISTSQRMQTNYASSPGKAKFPPWASVKPSRQWLSWGDSHCRCFWRRVEGGCTWGPGCTGRSWVGCGSTCSPNELRQRRRLHPPEQRHPRAEECLIRDIYPNPELKSEEEQRNLPFPPYTLVLFEISACCRKTGYPDLFNIVRFPNLYYIKYLTASL